MQQEPKEYRDSDFSGMKKVFLPDEEYARALDTFIIACCDAVIIDKAQQRVYLAKRKNKPAQGFWFIGGRRRAGIAPREAMQEKFKQETSLDIAADRFAFVDIVEYYWSSRQQEPQNTPNHTQGYTFAVELTKEERDIAAAHLDAAEYNTSAGLQAFSLEELQQTNVHPAVVALATKALT